MVDNRTKGVAADSKAVDTSVVEPPEASSLPFCLLI